MEEKTFTETAVWMILYTSFCFCFGGLENREDESRKEGADIIIYI